MIVDERKYLLLAPILIVSGFIIRIFAVAHAGSWWFDEAMSYSFAKLPILSSWHVFQYENNPPLYFWILHGWGSIFGFSEIALRSLSLIFALFTTAAIIRFARELFNRSVGWWAGAIYAVTTLSIFLDTEARMYSLLGLLIILAYLYFLKILFKTPTATDIALFIFFTTLALYTNVTALWLPITQVVMIIAIQPKTISRLKAFAVIVAPVVLFSPWLIAFVIDRTSFAHSINANSWRYFANGLPWPVILTEPLSFFNFLSDFSGVAGTISLLAAITLIVWFSAHAWKRRNILESKLIFVGLAVTIPLIISFFTVDLGSPRYYLQSAIFFWIMLAYAIDYGFEKIQAKLARVALVVAIIIYAIFNLQYSIVYAVHGNWDAAAKWIDAQHVDLVLAMPKLWSAEVYSPSTPFYFLPPPIPALEGQQLDPLQSVTRYNYNWGAADFTLTDPEKTNLLAEVSKVTASSSRIVFGYEGSEAEAVIVDDLDQLDFRVADTFQVDGYLPETLNVFVRQ